MSTKANLTSDFSDAAASINVAAFFCKNIGSTMLLLTNSDELLTHILRLAKAHGFPLPQNDVEFRRTYQSCLTTEQPKCFWLRKEGQSFRDSLHDPICEKDRQKFIDLYSVDTTALDDLGQSEIMKRAKSLRPELVRQLENAHEYLLQRSAEHAKFLDLIIERVFIDESDVAAGGTTSDAVGVIWANPRPEFAASDLAEFLVHELTHNFMFLDEWLYPHYKYEIMHEERTWALSAILDRKRPIDKVLHSLIVAAEVVLLREQKFGEPSDPKAHPPSHQIRASIETTIEDLMRVQESTGVLADRALELIDTVRGKVFASTVAAE